MSEEIAPKTADYTPHDREVVMAAVALWKSEPRTESLGMAKLHAAIKAQNPSWALSVNRLKSCLKVVNLLPQTAEQKQQLYHEQQYASQIRSKEMPGLDLAARTNNQVRLVTSKARGKGFHAVRDIKKDTVLWDEVPLVLVIPLEILKSVRQGNACAFCGTPFQNRGIRKGSLGTTSCPQSTCGARYCDSKCRSKDIIHGFTWHSNGTGKIKRDDWIKFEDFCVDNKWMGAYAYGIVLLTRLRQESTSTIGKPSLLKQQYESLATVGHDVRHHSSTKGTIQNASVFGEEQVEELWIKAHQLLSAVVSKVYDLSYQEFMDGVGAFNLNNVNGAIFMIQSHLNHSCEPNVHAKFHPKRADGLEIVTIADIKGNEELKVTYVDPKLGLRERQDELRHNWGFICVCPRCKREQKELDSQ